MMRSSRLIFLLLLVPSALLVVGAGAPAARAGGRAAEADGDAEALYAQHCASCHGSARYGGYSPPLIPRTLRRKSDEDLLNTILDGRPNTQMVGYRSVVDEPAARALVALMRREVEQVRWGPAEISASRVEFPPQERKIADSVARENVILVVERGSGSVSVLDGDSFHELDRYPVGRIHGGPKFDRALTRVYATTRDGTVVEYDLARGGLRTKAKVGVNTRNIAISPDGRFVAVANQLPPGLVILDDRLRPLASFPLSGQPSAVYRVPGEDRFVLSLRDAPRMISVGYPELSLRESDLPETFEDFMFVPGRLELLASSRSGKRILLYDLREGRVRAALATEGLPHLFSACFFEREGALHAALNHVGEPKLTLLDLDAFEVRAELPLAGAGYFARTHEGTPWIWIDTDTDRIQLVDKATLRLRSAPLIPAPDKKAIHVEFTADGANALVSVLHPAGAVVVYDSTTLEERVRLPYAMPVGKYNAHNKTRFLR